MSWIKFWLSCIAWAFNRWDRSEPILSQTAPLIWAVIAGLIGLLGIGGIFTALLEDKPVWFVLLLPYVGLTLLVAPYYLWKGQKDGIEGLRLTAPAVSVRSQPEDNFVRLVVKNVGRQTAYFTAFADVMQNGVSIGTEWPIRWRGTLDEQSAIDSGARRLLEVASVARHFISPLVTGPDNPTEVRVTFYTPSQQVGVGRPERDSFRDPYDQKLTLLRISVTSDPPMAEPYVQMWTLKRFDGDKKEGLAPTLQLEEAQISLS